MGYSVNKTALLPFGVGQQQKNLRAILSPPARPARPLAGIHEQTLAWIENMCQRLPGSAGHRVKAGLYKLQHTNILWFLEDARQSHLQVLDETQMSRQLTAPAKKANFITNISLVATGLAALGLVYWPLGLLSLPILLYRVSLLSEDSFLKIRSGKGAFNVELIEFLTSLALLVQGYFILAALDNVLFGIARILIEKVKHESRSGIVDVFRQQPRVVWSLVNGVEVELPIEAVEQHFIVVIHAGETIPIDGTVVAGYALVDQHILTGESQPREMGEGNSVFAMTVVQSGTIHVRVEKTGHETAAAQINQMLNDTVDYKTNRLLRSEEIADQTVWPLFVLSVLTFPLVGFRSALAVIDSHFKRKMSIAGAINILNSFADASEHGILIKDGRTLELLPQIDTVIFDKTGTLTEEQPHIAQIHLFGDYSEDRLLALAAAAEHKQTHPFAKAIREGATSRNLSIPPIDDADYKIGYGLRVRIGESIIRVGSMRFMTTAAIDLPASIEEIQHRCHAEGHSLVLVSVDEEIAGAIELHTTVRAEAKAVVAALRQRDIRSMYIISGDHETPTRKLAEELGIPHYFAEVLPENKAKLIEQLQNEGRSVCFVGDGINDSIALKKANVSVSLRGASAIAVDTAQVILMDQSLNHLGTLFDIAQELDDNTDTTFTAVLLPCVLCLGGALFLGFTQLGSISLNLVSLGLGVTVASLPLFNQQKREPALLPASLLSNAS